MTTTSPIGNDDSTPVPKRQVKIASTQLRTDNADQLEEVTESSNSLRATTS